MEFSFWASTDPGRVREKNEDNFIVDPELHLFVVCDGMGGHAGGEVASSMCVRAVREYMFQHFDIVEFFDEQPDDAQAHEDVLSLICDAIRSANSEIFNFALHNTSYSGMGTTCSLLLIREKHAFIAHVGDSRVYLSREGIVNQITEDHSLVAEVNRRGLLDIKDFQHLGWKNALTRAVGVSDSLDVTTYEFEIDDGDTFLLCSDGLTNYLPDDNNDVLKTIFGQPTLQDSATHAVEYACDMGGADNVTCVMVRVDGLHPAVETDFEKVRVALREVPFLEECTDAELTEIISVSQKYQIPSDTLIKNWSFEDCQLFIVLEGSLALKKCSFRNNRTIQRDLVRGDFFGASVIFGVRQSKVELYTHANTVLLGIATASLQGLIERLPQLGMKVLWPLARVAVAAVWKNTSQRGATLHSRAHRGADRHSVRRLERSRRRRDAGDVAHLTDYVYDSGAYSINGDGIGGDSVHIDGINPMTSVEDGLYSIEDSLDEDSSVRDSMSYRPNSYSNRRYPNYGDESDPTAAPDDERLLGAEGHGGGTDRAASKKRHVAEDDEHGAPNLSYENIDKYFDDDLEFADPARTSQHSYATREDLEDAGDLKQHNQKWIQTGSFGPSDSDPTIKQSRGFFPNLSKPEHKVYDLAGDDQS